jgi:hypothetical protein
LERKGMTKGTAHPFPVSEQAAGLEGNYQTRQASLRYG